MASEEDEYTFLCGYQRIRRYGSTCELNSPPQSSTQYQLDLSNRYNRVVEHRVESSDTLQSLELKYNSSMYDIKRLNRLWSNDSLHCKTSVKIPVLDQAKVTSMNGGSAASSPADALDKRKTVGGGASLERVEEGEESLDQLFKRIDKNVKKTQRAVKKMERVSRVAEMESESQ